MSGENMLDSTDAGIALLRGINVGGKNKLPMKDLAGMFTEAGCEDVRTYIQSGNVVFRADPAVFAEVPSVISEAIQERFGYQVPVVVRTAADLRDIVRANPFVQSGAESNKLHVFFLADRPDPALIDALDANRSPGDEFKALGREVYLHCPNGVAGSKLTNSYFDSALATTSTARNWRTVNKLLELAAPDG